MQNIAQVIPFQQVTYMDKGLLAYFLQYPDRLTDWETKINPDDLPPRSRRIYEAMLHLHQRGHAVDPLTVGQQLFNSGYTSSPENGKATLEEIQEELKELMPEILSDEQVETYVEHLKAESQRRHLHRVASDIQKAANDHDPHTATAMAAALVDGLSDRFPKKHAESDIEAGNTALNSIYGDIDNPKRMRGVPSGFLQLDALLRGFEPEELIVIGAESKAGKTTFCGNMAVHIAKQRIGPCVYFTLEMPKSSLLERFYKAEANLQHNWFMGSKDRQPIQEAHDTFMDLIGQGYLHIIYDTQTTIPVIRSHLRRIKKQHGEIAAVFVDYLGIIHDASKNWDRDEVGRLGFIAQSLKDIASEFHCPVIAPSQLNDDGQIRGSRQIVHYADLVAFLKKPKDQEGQPTPKDVRILDVSHTRNKPPGRIDLSLNGAVFRFVETKTVSNWPTKGGK